MIGSYICKCVTGHHGKNCQNKIEVSPEKVCPTTPVITCPEVNTATPCPACSEMPSLLIETSTSCPTEEPEPEVDHCRNDPCLNGGRCCNTTRGHVCMCPEYFTGDSCETGDYMSYNTRCRVFICTVEQVS